MELKDKVAIVTGGGRGIGRATAIALAKEDCNVVIASRTKKELEQTCSEIKKLNVKCLIVVADVSKPEDVKDIVDKTIKKFKKIDILINNAGVAIGKSLIETSVEEYDSIIDTNLKGVFFGMKYVLPYMIKQREGFIVNISSGAGKHGFSNLSAYCASKFGVIGLTESVAGEVSGYGIKVYAVCPGPVDTKMYYDLSSTKASMKPEHVAKRILELCLPSNRKPSGSSIEVYSIF